MKPKLKVGDILIAHKPKGRWQGESVTETKVTSVGRTYFTIACQGKSKFLVGSWRQADSNDVINTPINLYVSHDEMNTNLIRQSQVSALSDHLRYQRDWESLTNEQISAIHKIVYP